MNSINYRRFARIGIAIKGFIYFLMGVMAAITASNISNELRGSEAILAWISELSYGKIFLFAISIGLLGYITSRFILAFNRHDYNGKDEGKPNYRRLGYIVNGLGYTLLLYTSITMIIEEYSKESGVLQGYFFTPLGKIVVGIVTIGLAISAINEWVMAFTGMINRMTLQRDLQDRSYRALMLLGRTGRFSRGLVFAAFAYILARPLVLNINEIPQSESDAFAFMQSQFGAISMFVVASGLAIYGAFLMLSSRYRNIPIE